MMKHDHMGMKMMDMTLDALAADHAQMKSGPMTPELSAKMDKDLTDLEQCHAKMKAMHEKMRAEHPMPMHGDKMGSQPMAPSPSEQAEDPSDAQHDTNTRGNWPNTNPAPGQAPGQ